MFFRYLLVGIVNTVFGYAVYAALTALLMPRMHRGYLLALVIAHPINITFSFLNYKWFVFRTAGNYLREWSRCILVYAGSQLLNLLILTPLVYGLHRFAGLNESAPYIAGAILLGLTAVLSFTAHRNFSFASASAKESTMLRFRLFFERIAEVGQIALWWTKLAIIIPLAFAYVILSGRPRSSPAGAK